MSMNYKICKCCENCLFEYLCELDTILYRAEDSMNECGGFVDWALDFDIGEELAEDLLESARLDMIADEKDFEEEDYDFNGWYEWKEMSYNRWSLLDALYDDLWDFEETDWEVYLKTG